MDSCLVIPAKAGIHSSQTWIPAFAGMTVLYGLSKYFLLMTLVSV